MAKVKIDTGNGVCVVETVVELYDKYSGRDGLRWLMAGTAVGSGIRCHLESYYPTRSIARSEAKRFIQAITDTLTTDNDDE